MRRRVQGFLTAYPHIRWVLLPVMASAVLIRRHAVADAAAGPVFAWLLWLPVYRRRRKKRNA